MIVQFSLIISYLIIGFGLRRVPEFPAETGKALNLFVIYVSLPALVMLKVPDLEFSSNLLAPLILPWVVLTGAGIAVWWCSKWFKWDRQVTGCLLLLIPLGNTSFFGFPMVEAFFGSDSLPYAVLYDQVGTFIGLVTYGTFILALFGRSKTKLSWVLVLKKVFLFPPFIAGLVALSFCGNPYPEFLQKLLESLSVTLVPTVMVAVGYQISFRMIRGRFQPLIFGLTLKLVVLPLMVLALCRLLGVFGDSVDVSIFEAGMPPMVTAGALALKEDLAPDLAAALVGMGIILSCITLPILYSLL